ncbi:MAG: PIG-L family deacetylase [bacterium]|nr:PIG-L family deacetylase [bacterium]
MSTIMVISTYVDEIPLHAGGLIANHSESGDKVIVVVMCYPARPSKLVYPEAGTKESLYGRFKTKENWIESVASREIKDIKKILGIEEVVTLDYESCSDDLFEKEIIDKITTLFNEYEPDVVVTHWPIGDYMDFVAAGSSVMRVLITRKLEKIPQVYFSETLTGKHTVCFSPNVYVDISKSIEKKQEACKHIWEGKNEEYFFYPYALPIAEFRGRECCVQYAEAYVQLYGNFGHVQYPRYKLDKSSRNAKVMNMNRTVNLLKRGKFGEGTGPTYPAKKQK